MRNLLWIVLAAVVLIGGYMLFTGKSVEEMTETVTGEEGMEAPEALEDAAEAAGDAVDTATDTVADAVDDAAEATGDAADAATDAASDAVETATDAADDAAKATEGAVDSATDAAGDAADATAEAVKMLRIRRPRWAPMRWMPPRRPLTPPPMPRPKQHRMR